MKENLKKHPKYPSLLVSSTGEIYRDDNPIHKKGLHRLSTYYQKSGYENLGCSINGEKFHFLVHRLVAETYLPNPDNLPEVHHKDNNPRNNNVENLMWVTRKQNMNGVNTFNNNKTVDGVKLYGPDGNFLKTYSSIREAAEEGGKEFGFSASMMKKWKANNGYSLEYTPAKAFNSSNPIKCDILCNDEIIESFQSIAEAARYLAKSTGGSLKYIQSNKKFKEYRIVEKCID